MPHFWHLDHCHFHHHRHLTLLRLNPNQSQTLKMRIYNALEKQVVSVAFLTSMASNARRSSVTLSDKVPRKGEK